MVKQTMLSEIGEFGLISKIKEKNTIKLPTTILGIGDDCAVIEKNENEYTVITTDLLMEGIHFDLVYSPLKHLGYKAVMVNLSDIYAMNATPEHITVSIAVSAKFTVETIEQLYEGISEACKDFGVDLVGGDTSASITGLAISITAVGAVSKQKIVYRSGAKKNDLICVSGNLGASYMGLQILQREKKVFKEAGAQPKFDGYEYVLQRHLKPYAGKDIISQLLIAQITPTSMIDISDGLSSELFHICEQSKCGCKIFEEKIPIHDDTKNVCAEFSIEPLVAAMHGGEDYELLFTVPVTQFEAVSKIPNVSIIGTITDEKEGLHLISKSNDWLPIKAQGWTGFKNK